METFKYCGKMRMRILFLFFFVVGSLQVIAVRAQIINQDASGKSSIITPGSAININITESQIQASHFGSYKSLIWGIDMTGKNSSGIASLFDEGKFTPGASLSLLIGRTFVKIKSDGTDERISNLQSKLADAQNQFGGKYYVEVKKQFNASSLHPTVRQKAIKEVSDLDKKGLPNLPRSLSDYKTTATADSNEVKVINIVVKNIIKYVNDELLSLEMIESYIEQLKNSPTASFFKNKTTHLYARGGAVANQFSYDMGNTFRNYSARFIDTLSVASFFELGVSHQFRKNFVGFNLGFSNLSNMDRLTSADYSYSYQDTSVNSGKLTKTKNFTAYSGKYGFYKKLYLNADFQHLFTIATSKYIGIGPYARMNLTLDDDLVDDNLTFGISFNYLDGQAGKLLGGLYLQSSDISGQTQPNFKKSLQFGLIAKFSLSNLFITK